MSVIMCPNCGSVENFHKVSALREAEISTIETSSKGVGVGVSSSGVGVGVAKGKTTGTIQSDLAKKLAPPQPFTPSYSSITQGIAGILSGVLLIMGAAGGLIGGEGFGEIAFAVVMLLIGIFLIGLGCEFCSKKSREDGAKAEKMRELAHAKRAKEWQQRWYCKKCGKFFQIPE
jgi:ribosomal protein S27AE